MSHSIYNFLYYFSLVYLAIAGLVYVITVLIILFDKKNIFFKEIASRTNRRPVQIFAVFTAPLIFALGWIFLFPFVSSRK